MSAPAIISSGTAAGGPPVGGTGTTNTIPRWTGPSTLGDSQLKDNGTLVGIGASLTSGNRLVIGGVASGTSFIKANEATFQIGNIFAGPVQILTSDTPQVTVTGTGNVGIGTASPGFKCVVADTVAGVVTSEIRNDSTNSAATARLRFTTQGGESWIEAFRNAGGALTFATLSTERARIDSSGNFILNTANTGATIQAAGTQQGLKLPATPGNADTQTLDAYQEIGTGTPAEIALTLTCGTSGTITVNAASSKARVTRVGNKVIGHGRIVVSSVSAPLGRLSCVLTGCPQPFTNFLVETQTDNTTGLATGNRIVGTSDTSATPTIYFDRYSANTSSLDAAANIQAGTIIVFNICYSV